MAKLTVNPTYDSDNTEPPEVSIAESEQGNVIIILQAPRREVTLRKEDFQAAGLLFGR